MCSEKPSKFLLKILHLQLKNKGLEGAQYQQTINFQISYNLLITIQTDYNAIQKQLKTYTYN